MGAANFPTVSRGAADSVAAPQKGRGFQAVLVTGESWVDLTAWATNYVRITVIGDDYDVCFTNEANDAIDDTNNVAIGAAVLVPDRIANGQFIDVVVPGSKTILKYKPANGTSSTIRIRRA